MEKAQKVITEIKTELKDIKSQALKGKNEQKTDIQPILK